MIAFVASPAAQPAQPALALQVGNQTRLGRASPDDALKQRIAEIKSRSTSGGMEEEEYLVVFQHVRDHAPQQLLVWGLGYDSVTLSELNEGGTTSFLEPDAKWAAEADAGTQHLQYFEYNASEWDTSAGEAAWTRERGWCSPIAESGGALC